MQTSQGYIFCILQHFATKFCNFTNFIMFFLLLCLIPFSLLRLKFSLTCKLSKSQGLELLAKLCVFMCVQWRRQVSEFGGAFGGQTHILGGQDRIFKKVLLYRHRGTNILGISPPPQRGANAPGISPPL